MVNIIFMNHFQFILSLCQIYAIFVYSLSEVEAKENEEAIKNIIYM